MRLVLWIGLPLLLLSLAVGPRRVLRNLKAVWSWFTRRRLDPEEILTHVVRQHEQHVAALGKLLADEEAAEADIVANLRAKRGQFAGARRASPHAFGTRRRPGCPGGACTS